MEYQIITLAYALLIGIVTNLAGKWICEKWNNIPRLVWWVTILLPYGITHLIMISEPAFLRMVGLCTVLLLSMKVITYMEWFQSGGKRLPWHRWIAFSFLWFGMQPMAWTGKRRALEWKSHVRTALLSITLGAIGLSLYVSLRWDYFPLSFIFMSMMFHYGVLRLNTALWRCVGFPVRTLFRNPLVTTGFKDFWGARWNLAYSQMMARAVQKPLIEKLGQKKAIFAVFLISGLFHELAITVIVMEGFGLPFLFFLFQGIAVLIEKKAWWLRYACLLSLVIGLPVLFPPAFVTEIIEPVESFWMNTLNLNS